MSKGRISGITIELNGESTSLQKSLTGVNSSLKKTQTALNDVNKRLKFSPTSTEMLKQKQEYLAKAITETKDKLAQEKQALEQMQNSADSDKTTEQQNALQREIDETESRLKNLEKQARESASVLGSKMQAAGDKIQTVSKKVSDVGSSLTKNVSAPVVAVGTAAVSAFNEMDDGLDNIAKKTGASGKSLQSMEDIAKSIATTIPTDFETVGNAVGEVNTRFGVTGDSLQSLSQQFIEFADLNNTDVTTSVDNVQNVMAAYGIKTKDTGALLDTLNKVGQETGISMDDLSSSMVTNSASLKEMGFSASDAATFLGKCETSGADTSTVMAGLKKALTNASAAGKTLPEALSGFQDTMNSSSSDTDKLNAACDLFGKKSGAAIYDACKTGSLSFDSLSTSLSDASGSVDSTYKTTQDGTDKMKTAWNALKEAAAGLGDAIGNTLVPIMDKLSNAFKKISAVWDKMSPGMQDAIVKVGLVVAAIGPAILVVAKVGSAVGKVVKTVGKVITLGKNLLSLGSLANPVVLAVIIGIGLLIAAGVAICKNWDKIKAAASKLMAHINDIWNKIKTITIGLKNSIVGTFTEIVNGVKNKVNAIKDGIVNGFTSAKNKALEIFDKIKNGISSKMNWAKDNVKSAIDKIKNFFHFRWSLPSLKMPHFSASGKFSLKPLSVPHFSIKWYKSAYDNPVMFTSPTVMQTSSGLKGFGDGNGAEVVLGLNKLKSIAGNTNNVTITVYGAAGQNVNELATIIEQKITESTTRRGSVYA